MLRSDFYIKNVFFCDFMKINLFTFYMCLKTTFSSAVYKENKSVLCFQKGRIRVVSCYVSLWRYITSGGDAGGRGKCCG